MAKFCNLINSYFWKYEENLVYVYSYREFNLNIYRYDP
jgi:hypothetical protein